MRTYQLILYLLFLVVMFALAIWSMYAWYNYPCEAFKTGWLSNSYAPGRCIR
jgi:hypothetical protein